LFNQQADISISSNGIDNNLEKRMLRVFKSLLVVSFVILPLSQSIAAPKKDKGWARSIAAGVSLTGGNSDSALFTVSADAERVWEIHELRFGIDAGYGKSDGTKSQESGHGVGQFKRLINERWYGSVQTDVLHDGTADLSYRVVIGPGIGNYLIKTDVTRLSVEIGPSFVIEKLNGESETTFTSLRIGERFDKDLSEASKLWQSLEYLPQVDDLSGNYITNFEVGIEAAINKTMSMRIVGHHRYDGEPADNKRHYDVSLVSSLVFRF